VSDPIKAFLQASSIESPPFAPTSRYYGLATKQWVQADGRTVAYVTRRFVPSPERFAVLQEHVVSEGDRIDNLAARYVGDPGQYWRLCDANGAIQPAELTAVVGRRLRITLPEGIPGDADA